MKKAISILFALVILLGACKTTGKTNEKNHKLTKNEQEMKDLKTYLEENKITATPTESGLYFIELQKGSGKQPKAGDVVSVHYAGTLLDGTKFDSSYDRKEPIEFTLGVGQVIKGWDEGILMLKEGGKAKLIIPSKLAYGSQAVGGVIPAYSTLIFDVELVEVK